MSEKITWTHVDRFVREAIEGRGILPLGDTDAEVTLNFLKFVVRELLNAEHKLQREEANFIQLRVKHTELSERLRIQGSPISKTKKRLAALEAKVEELVVWTGLER